MADHLPYRVAAIDIDGTILDSSSSLRPAVLEAVTRVHDSGMSVVLCTGRRFRTALEVIDDLCGAVDAVICSGGALVRQVATGKTLFACALEHSTAKRICLWMRSRSLVPIVLPDVDLQEKEVLVSVLDAERIDALRYFKMNRESIGFYEGDYPSRLESVLEVYTCDHVEKVLSAYPEGLELFGARTVSYVLRNPRYGLDHRAMEFMSPRVSKARTLKWLIDTWNVRTEEVISIGDDVNDSDMLEMSGVGVAMANASESVRRAADFETLDNDSDGVAHALKRFLPECF